jgi:hypothetical protein
MTQSDTVHQCPFCELRFLLADEVRDHVIHDHPSHAEEFERVHVVELPRGS